MQEANFGNLLRRYVSRMKLGTEERRLDIEEFRRDIESVMQLNVTIFYVCVATLAAALLVACLAAFLIDASTIAASIVAADGVFSAAVIMKLIDSGRQGAAMNTFLTVLKYGSGEKIDVVIEILAQKF